MALAQTGAVATIAENHFIINPINLASIIKQKRLSVFYPAILVVGAVSPDDALNTLLDTGGFRILNESLPEITKAGKTIVFTLVKL